MVSVSFAGSVRAERARRRLTRQRLDEQLQVSYDVVWAIENGKRQATLPDVLAFCRALNLPLRELLARLDPEDLRVLGL